MRRFLLTILPKIALSRLTGLLARIPLPRWFRGRFLAWFARRYGADLTETEGAPGDFASLQAFFQRPLKPGRRPIAEAALVWPADGRIVTAGPITGGRIPQVKGVDYSVTEFLGNEALAARLAQGSQATIYLSPKDYHRVHSAFDAEVRAVRSIRGTLYPVNEPAVKAIEGLFVRNARKVCECVLPDGRAAALVMVGALNVGDISVTCAVPGPLKRGDEVGRFGFGSTVVVLVEGGGAGFGEREPGTVVRVGGSSL